MINKIVLTVMIDLTTFLPQIFQSVIIPQYYKSEDIILIHIF